MATSPLSALYDELQKFSHLQQLHSVLSKDLRACRDRVLKETRSVRRELTFFRWCMRRDLNEEYPFPSSSDAQKGMDYDRLLFYRKLICYLHAHPIELSKIIVSLPTIKHKPEINSLESLYFDKEIHLAECIAFDIMLTDINSLTLLLRSILLLSKNFNTLSQKLFQLFIVITCHKLLNTTFRSLLNRLYLISEPLSLGKLSGDKSEILQSTLYKSCDDVLGVIIHILRILPIPLRNCISVMKERVNNNPSELLEWLLSTIFSPLLLQPDDWYLVICNPSKDEQTNNNNIQYIVTTLLQLCRTYSTQETEQKQSDTCEITQLLLEKHGRTLTKLLGKILSVSDIKTVPSEVLVPSNATPELFIWHKILLKIPNLKDTHQSLYDLCVSVTPPKNIGYRPWITIQLPCIDFKNGLNIGSDDFTKQPKSQYLKAYVLKPIRVFLLSLSEAQSMCIESIDKYDISVNSLGLNTQQITLLYEARSRIKETLTEKEDINDRLNSIVSEYQNTFCNDLQEALSTHNVLSALNYIQNKEVTLKELRIIFIETHENLQMRDILYLSKQNVNTLRLQIEKIMIQINNIHISNDVQINGINDGSDWMNDKFTVQKTSKCISKTRNALIRFLNDYGIGKVDFKRKFGGSVLDFGNKRISSILVNAIVFEIKDVFWHRCPIEDGKFKYQIIELNNKYDTLQEFICGFLNIEDVENSKIKLPNFSDAVIAMMIAKIQQINDESQCETILDFEQCIAYVREALIASINGADSAGGDEYLPLFCYIIMKCVPNYLPSQLQTTKVISQRKTQDKYFIDCCVAMKALRNFCNVLFKNENNDICDSVNEDGNEQKTNIGVITPQIQTDINDETVSVSASVTENSNKKTTQSLFSSLRAKLPQRSTKSAVTNDGNGNGSGSVSESNANASANGNKKTFFNLSPTSSFSSFMNKNKSASDNEQERDENSNGKQKGKTLTVPQQIAPKPNVGNGKDEEQNENENENEKDTMQPNINNNEDNDIMVEVTTKI